MEKKRGDGCALPEQWVTFRDLYHCAIDPRRIGEN